MRKRDRDREQMSRGKRDVFFFDTVSAPSLFSKLTSLAEDVMS